MSKPLVAIVGRPNVGKSTLFNRLVGERVAIVEDIPGTTRDRLYGDSDWSGREFTVVDTGGLDLDSGEDVIDLVRNQAKLAIAEADVIIMVVDALDGLLSTDEEIADVLRRTKKPIVVAANKADSPQRRLNAAVFYQIGLGDVVPISAIHGTGTGDLLDLVVDQLPPRPQVEEVEKLVSVAIVGRPNVGKSSLLNALLGQERVIVSAIPGTTRDAIDTLVEHAGQPMVMIDTAGIRRRGKVQVGLEKYSVLRAFRAIDRADVAMVVIDAVDGPTEQDTHVAGHVEEAGKGVALVVNKWDLIEKTGSTMVQYSRTVREAFKFLEYAPILFVSAMTKQRVSQILDTALRIAEEREKRIPTSVLNDAIGKALSETPLSSRGKQLKVFYATQASTAPPTFVLFVNDPKLVHFSYRRFLVNRLRENFGFEGTPIRLIFRKRGEREE